MHTGRKILNLRCDRRISQQDLARLCEITPSALSKIEAGINSPRANIIWRIARNLGVTVEYLLDENMPYPHPSYSYRHEFLNKQENPEATVRLDVTREEKAFLLALRETHELSREIAFHIPEASVETIRLIHFLINHSQIKNPSQHFLKHFESLLTTGEVVAGKGAGSAAAPASKSTRARKKSAKKKKKRLTRRV